MIIRGSTIRMIRVRAFAEPQRWRQSIVAAISVLAWILLAALIASSYVGHSPGPYGTCAADNGRLVPCALLRR